MFLGIEFAAKNCNNDNPNISPGKLKGAINKRLIIFLPKNEYRNMATEAINPIKLEVTLAINAT